MLQGVAGQREGSGLCLEDSLEESEGLIFSLECKALKQTKHYVSLKDDDHDNRVWVCHSSVELTK